MSTSRLTRPLRRAAFAFVATVSLAVTLAACSSTPAPDAVVTPTTAAGVETTTTSAVPDSTQPPRTSTVGAGEGLLGLDLPGISGLALDPGPGNRPTLRWDPVADATRYVVLVGAAEGGPYWTADTTTTSVTVAEGYQPTFEGPRLIDGMTWVVLAFDTDGVLIAQSPIADVTG